MDAQVRASPPAPPGARYLCDVQSSRTQHPSPMQEEGRQCYAERNAGEITEQFLTCSISSLSFSKSALQNIIKVQSQF